MVTKNTTYVELRNLLEVINEFANEKLPLRSQLNLTRIAKSLEPSLQSLQPILDKIEGSEEEAIASRVEAWKSPLEVSFEPFDMEPIKDFVPSENKGYGFLLDFITV